MSTLKQPEQITFTEAALARIQYLMANKENQNLKLRICIEGGGCSGFQYNFDLDDQSNADDILINKVIVTDPMSNQFLLGARLDYIENLQGARFVVINPNAETTCGCGSSFSLKE